MARCLRRRGTRPLSPGRCRSRVGPGGLFSRAASCAAAGALVLATGACNSSAVRAARDTAPVRAVRVVRGVHAVRVVRGRGAPPWPSLLCSPPGRGRWRRSTPRAWLGDPSYRPLSLGVVPGSPGDDQMISYLAAQAASGVVGPSTWRIGDTRVALLSRSRAVVSACSYDGGSHFRSDGLAAPAALGGGAGLTSYTTDMTEVKGSWKVEKSATSAQPTTSSGGPCHRFGSRPLVSYVAGASHGPCRHARRRQARRRQARCRHARRERRRRGLDWLVHLVLGVVARQSAGPGTLHGR